MGRPASRWRVADLSLYETAPEGRQPTAAPGTSMLVEFVGYPPVKKDHGKERVSLSEVILHVGLHKSASTSIQHAWLERFGWVREGVWYPPPSAFGPGHASIASGGRPIGATSQRWCTPPSRQSSWLPREREWTDFSSRARSSTRSSQISSPGLATRSPGCESTVVLVLARPRARFLSAWQELLKEGRSGAQNERSRIAGRLARLDPGWATGMVGALQPDAVAIRLIDPQRTDASLPERLLQRVGVDSPPPGPASTPRRAANVGLDRVSSGLLSCT